MGAEPMARSIRLDLPLLLPDVQDLQDQCIQRLLRLLEDRDGVVRAHVVRPDDPDFNEALSSPSKPVLDAVVPVNGDGPALCLHYDPERLSLAQITEFAKAAGAGVTDRFAHVLLPLRAVGSEDNGWRLEAELRALAGVTAASVNQAGQVARIEYDRRRVDVAVIQQRLAELDAPAPEVGAGLYARNRELAWSLAAGVLLTSGWATGRFLPVPPAVPIALYLLSYLFGARDNVGHFLKDLRKGHFHFNIDLLMVVAAAGAAMLGQWVEGALLLFLFSLGHALEHYALGRARHAIQALAELAPSRALVLRDDAGVQREVEIPIEEVRPGDRVVVKPAGRIPVDGTVRDGRSSVNQAPITGESMPVSKSPGETVFAGTVNGEGALVVEVTAAAGDRTLDRVIKLVAEAETQKAPTQQFTDRFERVFVPVVLIADVLLIVAPPLLGVWTWHESFYRAMALLVAASPCALALGTPAAVLAGIAQAARKGVLIKGGAHLEALGDIRVLALDKTGTITKGEPAVTDLVPADGIDEAELLRTTAAVEQRSQHPLAHAILAKATERKLDVPAAAELEAITGRGIRSTVEGEAVHVGRLLMFEEEPGGQERIPVAIRSTVRRLEDSGRTTMVVRRGERWLGVIGIADEPRADVRATLGRLRDVGITRIVMLTGDNAGVGKAVGDAVGIDDVRAGLLPEDKVTAIKELAAQGHVAMVGDGVNDAPALAHATVGIAMGGAGTAAALETADIALMGDDLGRLPFAIGLSRQARRVIKQNLFVSLGVIGLLVIATVTGLIGIGPAVVMHEGSTLVVILNALRLLRYEDRAASAA